MTKKTSAENFWHTVQEVWASAQRVIY